MDRGKKVQCGFWPVHSEAKWNVHGTIPAGKAILFSPINVECSYAEFPDLKTESDLRACAKSGQDLATEFEVSIDGVNLQNLQNYRIQSPLFDLTLPQDNVFGLSPRYY